jgi:hypothetical protein
MKGDGGQSHDIETRAYFLLAIVALGAVYLLCYFSPVTYVRLVTEDQWGEYGTAVSFGVGGVLLLLLTLKAGPFSRKLLWSLAGICALLIAVEEINWGRRIFHFRIPDLFKQYNTQGEFNFHNIGLLDSLNRAGLHGGIGFLLLAWSLVSAALAFLAPNLRDRLESAGLPLIPVRLLPLFLLVPYSFLVADLPKGDEIEELFLGIAVAAWAIDLCFRYGMDKVFRGGKAVLIMMAVFFSCAVLTGALTRAFPGDLGMRLNYLASHSYPGFGMYDQSEQLYEYIYAHPQYLKPETRINHARMLMNSGQAGKSRQVLETALSKLGSVPKPGKSSGGFWMRRGILHSLLGESESADEDFTKAITADRRQVASTGNPDEKAELMWSIAQTFEARGDLDMALVMARQAGQTAVSAGLRRNLDRWVRRLQDQIAGAPSDDSL